jgi:sulfoxide reductase heme-binding subunit YedZ
MRRHRIGKVIVFLACLLPAVALVARGLADGLGANPIEEITHATGDWSLRLVLVTLAVTPIRRLSGWNGIIKYRRMLGLFAFTYVCLHFLTYLVLDQFFAWPEIVADIFKRPYITVGFTAFLLLVPLAVTSTSGWIRRLGGRRWQRLHRLIYVAAALAIIHYIWLVKADLRSPLTYGAILTVLLAIRVGYWLRRRASVFVSTETAT